MGQGKLRERVAELESRLARYESENLSTALRELFGSGVDRLHDYRRELERQGDMQCAMLISEAIRDIDTGRAKYRSVLKERC